MGRLRPLPDAPIVALDLDGTLGDYHRHFEMFAKMWTGRDIKWDPDTNGPFYKQLGMSRTTYRECKLAYRMGGMKRSIPVFPFAQSLTRSIRAEGVQVVACTTRPFKAVATIDNDTQHWIRRHRLQIDNILYGEHKYRDLARMAGRSKIICCLDDDLSQLDIARSLDIVGIMRRNEANKNYIPQQDQTFVWDLKEATDDILTLIRMYKKRAGVYAHRR